MVVKYQKKSNPSQVRVMERLEVEPSPCTPRVQKAKDRMLRTVPSIDLERAKLITESFMETEGEPMVVRRAKAFREQCQRKTIFIQDDELIIGTPGSRIRAGMLQPDAKWSLLEEELDTISTREQDPFLITEDQKRLFREFIKPYWKGKSVWETWVARKPQDIRQFSETTEMLYCDWKAEYGPGEYSAGYDWLINSGINGIKKKIEERMAFLDAAAPGDYDKITFLNALLIACDGINTLAKRYAELAREMASQEKEPRKKAELEKIAEVCQWAPANPARTFWEALQSLWLYHFCLQMEQEGPAHNPGRMDQYLYPYYKKDIEEGRITREQAQELLECLWVKFAEICILRREKSARYASGYLMNQNLCCGGITERGEDAVNELSYMMLQASMDVRLHEPTLSVRYNKGKNLDSFLHKVAELVSLGTGFPSIFNDEIGIRMMLDQGVSLEEAYNWSPGGCVEPYLAGKIQIQGDLGRVNLGSVVECALTNGIHRLTNTRMPVPETGDPRKFKTFDEFKAAVKTHLAYLIRKVAEAGQIIEGISQELRPLPVLSLTFKDCIEKAKDHQWGGAKYNSGPACVMVGIADIINNLAAVKKLIYDDKKLTWDELLEALDNDFERYEEIRQMCLSAPKYGNDIEEVDEIATEIFQFEAGEVRKYRGRWGSKLISGLYPVSTHVPMGLVVGALPSGRKAWTPLADGLSPTQGTDTRGPTAILKSVSKINHAMHTAGTLLNMKLEPSLFKEESGIRDFMSLVKSMCDLGIYELQVNVVSVETLRAAQKEPENYRDLMVRVAGYCAFFVELSKPLQDDIIARTMQTALVQEDT